MPRCTSHRRPSSRGASRYLPRRATSAMRRPVSLAAKAGATPPRRRRSRTRTATTRRPTMAGARVLSTVSISGSSGTDLRGERPRQSRERVEVERLGPRARRHLGTRKRALEVDAAAPGESGEGVAQHLPALSEGGSDHLTEALLVAEVDTRRDAPADVEHRRLDARRRKEAAAGYAERQADVREGSEENRRHAVVPGARPRDEPLRDLALG